jgi:TnsA endonuclease N terminal/TnsA endonuclease C terminal
MLSLLELLYFFVLEWASNVVDIREQYALLPLEETLAIANSCGIRHPVDPKTRQPIVMTTDFVVTVRHGDTDIDQPRTIKYRDDLFNLRTLEKLEIERRYWEARGKELKIVTECSIPRVLAKNVEWLHPYRRFQDFTDLSDLALSLIASIVMKTLQTRNAPLCEITISLDDELGLEGGTCLAITRHLLANRLLRVDMLKPINPRVRLILLN